MAGENGPWLGGLPASQPSSSPRGLRLAEPKTRPCSEKEGDAGGRVAPRNAAGILFRSTWAIVSRDLELIFHRRTGSAQPFDLPEDLEETRELSPGWPLDVSRLRDLAKKQIRHQDLVAPAYPVSPDSAPVLDDSTRQQLLALGYLQSTRGSLAASAPCPMRSPPGERQEAGAGSSWC
ncbi:MAG: hypothetical protein ABIU84_04165 [Thermoanaerobaculia bacterium]